MRIPSLTRPWLVIAVTQAMWLPTITTAAGDSTPPRVYLPITVAAEFPRGWALLEPAAPTVPMGGMTWFTLRLRNMPPSQAIELTVAFDASRLAIVDEDPTRNGVQILPGDWPPPAQQLMWPNVENSHGHMRISAWTFSEPLVGAATLARFRVRGRYPGSAIVRIVGARAGASFNDLNTQVHSTEVVIDVTGSPP